MKTKYVSKGDLVKIKGPVQYYSESDCMIVTDDSFIDKTGSVADTRVIGGLAKVKIDKQLVLVHPKNLEGAGDSEDAKWISPGSIVRITGPISVRTVPSYVARYNYDPIAYVGPPGATTTTKHINKLAEVKGQDTSWRSDQSVKYLKLLIKGKRGGTTWAVCWPSSVEPVISI